MKPIISVRNLSKKYIIGENIHGRGARTFRDIFDYKTKRLFRRDVKRSKEDTTIWALKDVSFDVDQGEVVGIIGRNGAGKSTLLKILSRITEPTEGDITLRGRVASLLEVGTGFSQELTGRENIFLNGSILGMKKTEIKNKFDEIVSFAEIEKFIDTPVKRYSSGMYVRLAFAVAAHLEPEILLVDEVLAVGDAAFQKKSQSKMGKVAKAGRTVLVVSHNMSLIRNTCTAAIQLDRGIKVMYGDAVKTVDHYLASLEGDGGILDMEVTEAMHAWGVSKIRIYRIGIADEGGHPLRDVLYHQPICVRIQLSVLSPIEGVAFGLEILTNERVSVMMVHNVDNGSPYLDLPVGRYSLIIKLSNILKAGYYGIHFGAHQKPGNLSVLHMPESLYFRVCEVPYYEDEQYNPINEGLVDGTAEWVLKDES